MGEAVHTLSPVSPSGGYGGGRGRGVSLRSGGAAQCVGIHAESGLGRLVVSLQGGVGGRSALAEDVVRAKKPQRLPVVLSIEEVRRTLAGLDGELRLGCSLLYGTGMRLMEVLRLRVKDVDFARNEILVRDGKGMKDRVTVLPRSLLQPLRQHLSVVRAVHKAELEAGWRC